MEINITKQPSFSKLWQAIKELKDEIAANRIVSSPDIRIKKTSNGTCLEVVSVYKEQPLKFKFLKVKNVRSDFLICYEDEEDLNIFVIKPLMLRYSYFSQYTISNPLELDNVFIYYDEYEPFDPQKRKVFWRKNYMNDYFESEEYVTPRYLYGDLIVAVDTGFVFEKYNGNNDWQKTFINDWERYSDVSDEEKNLKFINYIDINLDARTFATL